MSTTVVPRNSSVLKSKPLAAEPKRIAPVPETVTPARGFQVLQSSRAPAQLCLFLRHGATDVK